MRTILLTTLLDAVSLTFELAARTVDVVSGFVPDESLRRRVEELEERNRVLEQELAASRRVDAARRSVHERQLERYRLQRWWS